MSMIRAAAAPKSDQINADDLIGGKIEITITAVKVSLSQEQPVSISFAGSTKVYRPCKTMMRVLMAGWGDEEKEYVGKRLLLFRDAGVTFGRDTVGGIRIKGMSHLERDISISLTKARGVRVRAMIEKLETPSERPEVKPAPTPTAGITDADHLALAIAAARKGTDAFRAWWTTPDGVAARHVAKAQIVKLQAIAAETDKAMQDDPFGLPPLTDDDTITPEQIAQQAAAEAAFRAEQEANRDA